MIRVRALGDGVVQLGRKRITLATEGIFALAFHLAVRAGERIGRDELVETFWPGSEPTNGRHALRQMMYRLRQKGFVLDEESGEELYLDPARVDCDLSAVLGEEWPETADAAAVEAAGQPTPTFTRHISERFQEWNDELRARVERQHRRAALRQIVRARREGRWSDLEVWARQVLRSDPLNEEATLARAESAAMAGSKAMALEILDQYMEELGDRAAQIGLPATVLRRRIAERKPEWPNRGPREVPLVGRAELMSKLTGLVDAAGRGEGSAVLLWGAPGVGKSRIADEVVSYAALSGFQIASVGASRSARTLPLGTILSFAPALLEMPGAAGCHPSSLSLLERARNYQREPTAHDPPHATSASDTSIALALLDLIESVSAERRLLLHVDDLHYSDSRSRDSLAFLFAESSASRVLWLTTSRARFGAASVSPSDRTALMERLVRPLEEDAAVALAEATTTSSQLSLSPEETLQIARASGGNPLFVRELAIHFARKRAESPVPQSLAQLMEDRLARLDAVQTRLLRLIALLGAHATIPRIRNISMLQSDDIAVALEVLEREGMIRMNASHVITLHDCWHTAVMEGTSPVARAALSLDCAESLATHPDSLDDEVRRCRAAELYEDAGDLTASHALLLQAADQLSARGLDANACVVLERALKSERDATPLLQHRMKYSRALFSCGRLSESLTTASETLERFGQALERDQGTRVALSCLQLDALAKLRQQHRDALKSVVNLAADPTTPVEARLQACLTAIAVAFNDTSSEVEDVLFSIAHSIERAPRLSVAGQLVLLIYHTERGDRANVDATESRLAALESEPVSDQLRCRTLRSRALAQRFAGNRIRAVELGERAYVTAMQGGLLGDATFAAEHMVFAALDACDTDAVESWLLRWDSASVTSRYFERRHARTHAECRILIAKGDFESALAQYGNEVAELTSDPMGKRRAVDLAAISHCLAALGRRDECLRAIDSGLQVAEDSRPSGQVDYMLESIVCALALLGESHRATAVATRYLQRRQQEFSFPIPPAFSTLQRQLVALRHHG